MTENVYMCTQGDMSDAFQLNRIFGRSYRYTISLANHHDNPTKTRINMYI